MNSNPCLDASLACNMRAVCRRFAIPAEFLSLDLDVFHHDSESFVLGDRRMDHALMLVDSRVGEKRTFPAEFQPQSVNLQLSTYLPIRSLVISFSSRMIRHRS